MKVPEIKSIVDQVEDIDVYVNILLNEIRCLHERICDLEHEKEVFIKDMKDIINNGKTER